MLQPLRSRTSWQACALAQRGLAFNAGGPGGNRSRKDLRAKGRKGEGKGKGGKGAWKGYGPPKTAPKPPPPEEPPLPLHQLVQPTGSPWVWASAQVTEMKPMMGQTIGTARKYFEKYGAASHFIPPSEFGYELPSKGVPEIAFAGRSNVGKSSLLAALLGRSKGLVRISKTPGCTGSVNYFPLGSGPGGGPLMGAPSVRGGGRGSGGGGNAGDGGGPHMYLVDLPGYGFAKVSKTEQEAWSSLLTDFLSKRGFLYLRRVMVLVDSRRGASPEDWVLMETLSAAQVPFVVVLTKADTVTPDEAMARAAQVFDELRRWRKIRPTHLPSVHVVSAKTGSGLNELRLEVADAAGLQCVSKMNDEAAGRSSRRRRLAAAGGDEQEEFRGDGAISDDDDDDDGDDDDFLELDDGDGHGGGFLN